MMVMNILFSVAFTLTLGASLSAQPAQPPASSPQTPARPYQPESEIPKQDGRSSTRPTPPQTGEVYVIGPQDSLSVIVTDEADLTNKYRVDTDGTITMPYLNRVPVAGLTLAEAQVKIAQMLQAGYLRNPQVRVEVDQFKSRRVFVSGEVRTPGYVTMAGTTMTLLEALALAGSPTQNASNDIKVVHPSKPGEKPNEPISRLPRCRIRARLVSVACFIHLAGRDAGQPDLGALATPDRPVAIINCSRSAGE